MKYIKWTKIHSIFLITSLSSISTFALSIAAAVHKPNQYDSKQVLSLYSLLSQNENVMYFYKDEMENIEKTLKSLEAKKYNAPIFNSLLKDLQKLSYLNTLMNKVEKDITLNSKELALYQASNFYNKAYEKVKEEYLGENGYYEILSEIDKQLIKTIVSNEQKGKGEIKHKYRLKLINLLKENQTFYENFKKYNETLNVLKKALLEDINYFNDKSEIKKDFLNKYQTNNIKKLENLKKEINEHKVIYDKYLNNNQKHILDFNEALKNVIKTKDLEKVYDTFNVLSIPKSIFKELKDTPLNYKDMKHLKVSLTHRNALSNEEKSILDYQSNKNANLSVAKYFLQFEYAIENKLYGYQQDKEIIFYDLVYRNEEDLKHYNTFITNFNNFYRSLKTTKEERFYIKDKEFLRKNWLENTFNSAIKNEWLNKVKELYTNFESIENNLNKWIDFNKNNDWYESIKDTNIAKLNEYISKIKNKYFKPYECETWKEILENTEWTNQRYTLIKNELFKDFTWTNLNELWLIIYERFKETSIKYVSSLLKEEDYAQFENENVKEEIKAYYQTNKTYTVNEETFYDSETLLLNYRNLFNVKTIQTNILNKSLLSIDNLKKYLISIDKFVSIHKEDLFNKYFNKRNDFNFLSVKDSIDNYNNGIYEGDKYILLNSYFTDFKNFYNNFVHALTNVFNDYKTNNQNFETKWYEYNFVAEFAKQISSTFKKQDFDRLLNNYVSYLNKLKENYKAYNDFIDKFNNQVKSFTNLKNEWKKLIDKNNEKFKFNASYNYFNYNFTDYKNLWESDFNKYLDILEVIKNVINNTISKPFTIPGIDRYTAKGLNKYINNLEKNLTFEQSDEVKIIDRIAYYVKNNTQWLFSDIKRIGEVLELKYEYYLKHSFSNDIFKNESLKELFTLNEIKIRKEHSIKSSLYVHSKERFSDNLRNKANQTFSDINSFIKNNYLFNNEFWDILNEYFEDLLDESNLPYFVNHYYLKDLLNKISNNSNDLLSDWNTYINKDCNTVEECNNLDNSWTNKLISYISQIDYHKYLDSVKEDSMKQIKANMLDFYKKSIYENINYNFLNHLLDTHLNCNKNEDYMYSKDKLIPYTKSFYAFDDEDYVYYDINYYNFFDNTKLGNTTIWKYIEKRLNYEDIAYYFKNQLEVLKPYLILNTTTQSLELYMGDKKENTTLIKSYKLKDKIEEYYTLVKYYHILNFLINYNTFGTDKTQFNKNGFSYFNHWNTFNNELGNTAYKCKFDENLMYEEDKKWWTWRLNDSYNGRKWIFKVPLLHQYDSLSNNYLESGYIFPEINNLTYNTIVLELQNIKKYPERYDNIFSWLYKYNLLQHSLNAVYYLTNRAKLWKDKYSVKQLNISIQELLNLENKNWDIIVNINATERKELIDRYIEADRDKKDYHKIFE